MWDLKVLGADNMEYFFPGVSKPGSTGVRALCKAEVGSREALARSWRKLDALVVVEVLAVQKAASKKPCERETGTSTMHHLVLILEKLG